MAIDPVTALLDIGGKVIDRIFPNPEQKAAAQLELIKLQQSGELAELAAQTEINKIEAASNSRFVSGWRPFVGWVCGASLLYSAMLEPIARFVARLLGYEGDFPVINTDLTMQVLIGMLGLGVYRTYEKKNGVANK